MFRIISLQCRLLTDWTTKLRCMVWKLEFVIKALMKFIGKALKFYGICSAHQPAMNIQMKANISHGFDTLSDSTVMNVLDPDTPD